MAATVLSDIPSTLNVGDTWRWLVSLPDYPANDGWTLTYKLVKEAASPGTAITVTCAASGADHYANVAPATTDDYAAGTYRYRAYAEHTDGRRYRVADGRVTLAADFEGTLADPRSHARRTLDLLRAVIEGKATADMMTYSVAGMQVSKMSPKQLTEWADYYEAKVAREDQADLIRAGGTPNRNIGMRFTAPQ